MFLKNASINYSSEFGLTVTCVFHEALYEAKDLSCVVVGREDGNKTLLVIVAHSTASSFPVILDDNTNYTFGIFGKNTTYIDEIPIITRRLNTTRSPGILH